ncbi:MAG: hypothetical protein H5T46_00870 [Archaeoglobi archaeon]|nr:hypothetical protein [Candidatus Mnemosynella sp.]
MSDFERELVRALNELLGERGVAYRLKQHKFATQITDILVDSPFREFYCAIECKSISQEKGANALYFSQHFTISREGHQIERISEFLRRSGRIGLLAVEIRKGSGKSRKAHIIPWGEVERRFLSKESGMSIAELESYPEIPRDGRKYVITEEGWIELLRRAKNSSGN